jgi:hypothetical protein
MKPTFEHFLELPGPAIQKQDVFEQAAVGHTEVVILIYFVTVKGKIIEISCGGRNIFYYSFTKSILGFK